MSTIFTWDDRFEMPHVSVPSAFTLREAIQLRHPSYMKIKMLAPPKSPLSCHCFSGFIGHMSDPLPACTLEAKFTLQPNSLINHSVAAACMQRFSSSMVRVIDPL